MRRIFPILLLITLALVACSGVEQPIDTPPPATTVGTLPEPMATEPAEPESPTAEATAVEQPADAATEPPTVAESAATELPATEPPQAAEIAVNGPYENTYFRGREDAPVTVIDYSDFL